MTPERERLVRAVQEASQPLDETESGYASQYLAEQARLGNPYALQRTIEYFLRTRTRAALGPLVDTMKAAHPEEAK